jgi:peptidoglycan hydrolase-like protein with peptidoglycan-binding domain
MKRWNGWILVTACAAAMLAFAVPGYSQDAPARTPNGDVAPANPLDSDVIAQTQVQLKQAGFDPGSTSGLLDPATRDAIRQFQRSRGLNVTGELDQLTRAALLDATSPGTGAAGNSRA